MTGQLAGFDVADSVQPAQERRFAFRPDFCRYPMPSVMERMVMERNVEGMECAFRYRFVR